MNVRGDETPSRRLRSNEALPEDQDEHRQHQHHDHNDQSTNLDDGEQGGHGHRERDCQKQQKCLPQHPDMFPILSLVQDLIIYAVF